MTEELKDKELTDVKYLRARMTGNVGTALDQAYNLGFFDGEKNVAEKIKAEIGRRSYGIADDRVIQGMKYERADILEIIDKYITKEGDNINEDKQAGQPQPTGTD